VEGERGHPKDTFPRSAAWLTANKMKKKRYHIHVFDDFQLMGKMLVAEANSNAAISAAKKRLRFKAAPWDCRCGLCSYSKRTEWCGGSREAGMVKQATQQKITMPNRPDSDSKAKRRSGVVPVLGWICPQCNSVYQTKQKTCPFCPTRKEQAFDKTHDSQAAVLPPRPVPREKTPIRERRFCH
jgi:hypothetical protein